MSDAAAHMGRLTRMRDSLKGAKGTALKLDRRTLEWALAELRTTRADALHEAAEYASFYAEERMRLCGDAILHDPVLSASRGAALTRANLAQSRDMQVDGTINSAGYHAATHIAEHLLALANEAAG